MQGTRSTLIGALTVVLITFGIFITFKRYNGRALLEATIAFAKRTWWDKPTPAFNNLSSSKIFLTQVKLLSKLKEEHPSGMAHLEKNVVGYDIYCYGATTLYFMFYENFILKTYYFKTDKREPFIIDAGGNIGITTLFFKTLYPNAQILVFEPASANFELLQRNIQTNNLLNVTPIHKALSSTTGTANLFLPGTVFGSLFKEKASWAKAEDTFETVQTVPLSEYITKEVDFLKMDIEGAEIEVIDELAKSNTLGLIKQMIMEFHYAPETGKLGHLLSVLEDHNFKHVINTDSSKSTLPFEKIGDYTPLIFAYQE